MPTSSSITPGSIIGGKYRIEAEIGEGGMASVFAAYSSALRSHVAIKLLKPELATDLRLVGRFVREGRIAARIDSRHVARIHEFGICEKNGIPFIAFELLQGEDLEKVLAAHGPMPVSLAVDYVMQALVGVAAAHFHGIAHRDLKPANLFRVQTPGQPPVIKVLDFGVAKALRGLELERGPQTSTSALIGTPPYMAPEQLRSSKRIDARADIWSVGVVLYELLTAAHPFDGATFGALLAAIMKGSPVPIERHRADLPPPLVGVILKCLQKERDHRFQSVKELATALAPFGSQTAHIALSTIHEASDETLRDRFSSDEDLTISSSGPRTAPPPASAPAPAPARSSRLVIIIAALFVLLGAGGVGFFLARR
jgi:serine/threonine-protein kinase